MASVGSPPVTSRAGAVACTTPSVQPRQAYLGRRVTSTRNFAGTTSSRSETSSPIRCSLPPQHGQLEALRLDDPLDPRQVLRQRAAVGTPTLTARPLQRRVGGIRLGSLPGDLLLGILQRQLELAGVELLRAPAEHRPLEGIDDGREPRDLLCQVEPRTALGRQHRLQRRGIVRQVGSIETGSDIAHGRMWSTGRRGCDRQHPA